MGVGEIAGLIAAIAFAVLAGFMIYPLIRLGKMFDQISQTVKESGEHAIPALDEGVTSPAKAISHWTSSISSGCSPSLQWAV